MAVARVFRAAPAHVDPPQSFALRLPITTPPMQVPKLVSVGLAQSDYARSADYSRTSPRTRVLWLEFDQPLQDPHDVYFGRVLANAPDPALTDAPDTPDLAEPPLPVDPRAHPRDLARPIRRRGGAQRDATPHRDQFPAPLPAADPERLHARFAGTVRHVYLRVPGRPCRRVVDGAGALRPPAAGDRRAAPGADIDLLGPSRTGRPGSQRPVCGADPQHRIRSAPSAA